LRLKYSTRSPVSKRVTSEFGQLGQAEGAARQGKNGQASFRMFQIVVWIGHGTVSSRLFCQTGAPEAGKQIKQKSLRTEMPKKWIPHCKDKQVWYKLFLDI